MASAGRLTLGRLWLCLGLILPMAPAFAANQTESGETVRHSGKHVDENPVVFSADEVNYDDQLDIVVARGHVELSQSGRTVLADSVSYNQRSDTVTANGNVSLIEDATGATVFGNYVELHDNMKDGFIKDVRMLLADRSRIAGNTGRRYDANRTDIYHGVYSPCDLCKNDPSEPPLWQIKAARIDHDKANQVIEFYDATIDLDGVPVLWTPYISHPDPTVKRASGFLPGTFGNNTILGFDTQLNYFWAIDQDKDLTLSPEFTTKQGTILESEYRQRFSNGSLVVDSSIGYSDPNASETPTPYLNHDNQLRGDIFAYGELDLTENLRAGLKIQRTSDLIFLPEFKISNNPSFLDSDVYLEDFDGRNYGSVFAYDFQALAVGVQDRTQPIVLPVADYQWSGMPQSWGGRFTTDVNALDILRETGASERRLSAGTQLDLPFSGGFGQKFNFVAGIRTDGYYVLSQPLVDNGPLTIGFAGRVFPQMGLEWRDPWVKQDGKSTFLIEPMVAAYAAPVGLNPAKIPNIDAENVDFNDTELFTRNRFAGYDQVDSGQRVDYGVHADWREGDLPNVDALVGQSYRFQKTSPFAIDGSGDGLENQTSDYVGRVTFTPADFLDLGYHFRFAETDLRPERQEVVTTVNAGPVKLNFTYVQLAANVHDFETARQQVSGGISLRANEYWTFIANSTRDVTGDGHLLAASASARYSDECATMLATVGENGIVINGFKPGVSVVLQLILKDLGVVNVPLVQTTLGGSE